MLRWKIKRALNLFYFSFIKKKIPKHVKDTNILFVHIPKAAGISITKSLYGQEIGHKRSVDFMRADENWFNNANKFSIVRNPYTRLISAYNFLKDGGIEKYKFDKEFSVFINSFENFEDFVYGWLSIDDNKYNYTHFIPQVDFIYKGNVNLLDKVGKLEELDDFFNELQFDWGLTIDNKKLNISKTNYFTLSELAKDKDLMETIYSIYKDDFIKLGYDKDITL